ncbi:hypothetical protein AAFF_G00126130 [Aldrovandia affinis]|uniref:Uncharacterized protein n=1 Tax=Aldrovandia affinis TaxID=143900 RepID=A0AAD7W9H5_9TELE|nr:hypothetical protein AAFF_G00126130 [Aldrovandia affinis]
MSCMLLPLWVSDHDMLRVSLPMDKPKWGPGFWCLNTSLLGSDAFVKAFTGFYGSVRTLRPLFTSLVEWWEAAKSRLATFCPRYAVVARQRDRAGVAKWMASVVYLHGCFNRGEPVDWAIYEGAKERLRGLLEARAKALAFQAWLCELEEGERPMAYFFKASRVRWGAPRLKGRRCWLWQSYYTELFSGWACDPAAEAYLLDCVSARLGGEEAWSMEAGVTLEEVREALLSLGTTGSLRSSTLFSGTSWG